MAARAAIRFAWLAMRQRAPPFRDQAVHDYLGAHGHIFASERFTDLSQFEHLLEWGTAPI
ncbi:MAG: hypothetical protein WD942_09565 [Dehalococcoidia bacterium]